MNNVRHAPPYADERNHLTNPTAHKPKAQTRRLGIFFRDSVMGDLVFWCMVGAQGRTCIVFNGPDATIVSINQCN